MVKVCHMTSAHNSSDVRIFHKECVSLASAGYDTFLVARGKSREENGVHIIGVGQPSGGRLSRMTGFAKRVYVKALALDAEIYHLHDPELLPYGLKLKRHGKRVIFDSHENYPVQLMEKHYLPQPFRKVVSLLYKAYETFAVSKYDAVIVPCTFGGKDIFENRARQSLLIANYQPVEQDMTVMQNMRQPSSRVICYAGSITSANGLTNAVLATAHTKATLVLAGWFSPPEYQKTLCTLPEYSHVDYRGTVSFPEVKKIYATSNIGYYVELPIGQNALVDTFGMKVYEYMSMGLPIIVDRTPYSECVINAYHCGICVDPHNLQEIEDAISRLLDNPQDAKQMGENGRKAVLEKYNWATEEKKLLALYEELCRKPNK